MKIHFMVGVKSLLQLEQSLRLFYLASLYDLRFELVSINDV